MKDSVNVIQLTDLHITAGGALLHGVADTAAALAQAVAQIDAMAELLCGLDGVIVTGDLADLGEPDAYARIARTLAGLPAPVHVTAGNHDDRAALRAGLALPGAADAPCDFVADCGPVRLIGLDSSVPGQPHGALGAESLALLRDALGAGRPTLVSLHHPPVTCGVGHMDRQNLRDAEALAQVLRGAGADIALTSGHFHRAMTTTFAGRLLTVAPAPCHAVRLDLRRGAASEFDLEPGAMTLHRWTAENGWMVHFLPLGQFPGPFPFPPPLI